VSIYALQKAIRDVNRDPAKRAVAGARHSGDLVNRLLYCAGEVA